MKIFKGFNLSGAYDSGHRELYSIKLCKFLCGLKQYGHMWYKHFNKYLLKNDYQTDIICLCVFIKECRSIFFL